MKTAIKTTKMIAMGLFTFCAMGLANTTFAGTHSGSPAELKLVGKNDNHPVFQLSLNNDETGSYYIYIKDSQQNTLYSETVKGSNLSRRYQLNIDEADLSAYGGVQVEVTSAKTHKTEVYKITSQTKTTSNIVVAQL